MRKVKILLIFGVLVSVLPYLGFPLALKNILITLCGLEIVYLGYYFYKENGKQMKVEENKEVFENFSENSEFTETLESKENA